MKYFFLLTSILILSTCLHLAAQSNNSFCYTEASSQAAPPPATNSFSCPKYVVRVYFHFVKSNSNPGYNSTHVQPMLTTLNDIYQNYGISFVSSGYRDWYSDFYADPNTETLAFLGIFSASDANPQSNAINLYILPPNNPVRGGKAKGTLPSPSNALFIGGTRPVQFNCAFRDYEIALTKVIAHEVGHCLGLNHTNREADGDGDGLSDTPLDFNTNEACINPDNCQFVGPQFSGTQQCNPPCNTPSNPQTPYFSNVMAGNTLPQCMSQFSPMQVAIMKNNLAGPINYVVDNSLSVSVAPDLQSMYYNTMGSTQPPKYVYTYNSVSANTWWRIQTNLNSGTLSGPISWNPNPSVNAFANGPNNVDYYLNLSSGQSTNIAVSATNACGTSNRTISFSAYSGYRVYPNPAKNTVYIAFDNIEKAELLPDEIRLLSDKSTVPVFAINVQDACSQRAFKNGNQIEIDVKNLPRGTYYLHVINERRKDLEKDIIRLVLE